MRRNRNYIYTAFAVVLAIKMLKDSGELLIATTNTGKLAELRRMLDDAPVDLKCLTDFPSVTEVAETGLTFVENASLKACGYARQTGIATLADDSGLEVRALNGRPGVLSARYGGDTSFAEKMEVLLAEIAESGSGDRRARFVCSIAIADKNGTLVHSEQGICDGTIALRSQGEGGFGFDPIFIPSGHNLTFGELPEAIKRQIGHRGRAFAKILPYLHDFIAV